jgi:hypothetical protein
MKTAGNSGNFAVYFSLDGSAWQGVVKGTYSAATAATTTKPAPTITEVYPGVFEGGPDERAGWNEVTPGRRRRVRTPFAMSPVCVFLLRPSLNC